MTEYAMYKGDTFIDLGTIAYLAKKYHKTEEELMYLSYPSAHKKNHGKMVLLYKMKDESNDVTSKTIMKSKSNDAASKAITKKREELLKKYDLKIGAVVTPHELSNVFQSQFMKYKLGIAYHSYNRTYVARSADGKDLDAKFNDELVYLGFGCWKKKQRK